MDITLSIRHELGGLALFDWNQSRLLKPCRSVYIEMAQAMLHFDLGTNYHCLCQQDKRRDDLPSWVIN